ncbi:RNA polymerase sigma factor [Echinicola vietnamensis]|uniref:RNA polymerase sigma factor n=1 Tax=Echinicola vietnamensis (strain DSM 17526 / LMG 23754 / KMM 6221) TaxID=926556 RepID=L0G153_ECHVK|nr:sigma-70 family RNA polymerase sigma factor [Echinicola vietnamensis]AGA79013.1 RNA polymerase sigma factor, sigma-70 family [Echinicola vietnamensis DSM 17526]
MNLLDDTSLLKLINNPQTREKGYRMLVNHYQKRIYSIIRKMVIIHEDADDLVQNTFVKAFKNINNFKRDSSLFTWLYRIAINECLNFLEKKKKRNFFRLEDHEHKMAGYLDSTLHIEGDEIQLLLQKLLLKLPKKQRLVFNMKYFENLSYAQISEITKTSEGALKASYHHAVKKIENEINPD